MQCTWRAVIDVCGSCPALLVTGQQSVFNGTTRSLHQSILKTCGDKTKIEFIEVGGVANVLEEKVKLLRCPSFLPVNTSPATAVAKYCDEHVCLSVCPRAYLRNHTCDLYQFFCACCLWPWFGPFQQGDEIPRVRGNFGDFPSQ